jgi:uncharacterized protein YggU (UPF0235/DUF167 family)
MSLAADSRLPTTRPWTPLAGGLRLVVRVTPRGGRDGIDGIGADADGVPHLKVRVAAVPADGAANEAVEKIVAKWLGVPRSTVEVVQGATARLKTLRVDGDPVKLIRQLQELTA